MFMPFDKVWNLDQNYSYSVWILEVVKEVRVSFHFFSWHTEGLNYSGNSWGKCRDFSKETRRVKHCSLNVSFCKQFLLESLSHCSCKAQFCTPSLGFQPTNLCGINFKHVGLWTSIGTCVCIFRNRAVGEIPIYFDGSSA